MASTNFKIFNEENAADRTYNDSEYEQATQRQSGVIPGIALSRLHNKLYMQVSVMSKAVADFLVGQGFDCNDNEATKITENIEKAIKKFNKTDIDASIIAHNNDEGAHETRFSKYEKKDDLGNDIIKKLALTTAISVVSSLQSNSWFSQLLKWALTASGVRYNLATNGYVCFGALFGGLIVQWGTTTAPENYSCHATLPVAFTSTYCAVGNGSVSDNDAVKNHGCAFIFDRSSNSQITFRTTSEKAPSVRWVAVGY
jgi:hypothetical protein